MARVLYGWAKDDIHQGLLEQVVRKLFAEKEVTRNARKTGGVVSPHTGHFLELDLWLPTLDIAFEFQDPYHYITTWDYQAPLDLIKQSDLAKQEGTLAKQQTLVLVPCWWDGLEPSLVATIHFLRPDLLGDWPRDLTPIALNPPKGFFKSGSIPDIGELMLASFPLSVNFTSTISPENFWWIGEKYDGVRYCWNYYQKKIYSRSGLVLPLPTSFANHMPSKVMLDGEFWFGRGTFQDSQRLILSDDMPITWDLLRLIAFDDPSPSSHMMPFELRYEQLITEISLHHPFIAVAARGRCTSRIGLKNLSKAVIADEGEGVVLRRPKSLYEHGRSSSLLKLKATRGDKEALVVTSNPIVTELQLPDGTIFTAPSLKDTPVHRGDIVTFVYTTFSRNQVPTQPRILRIRSDVSWQDVLRDHDDQPANTANDTKSTKELSLNERSRNTLGVGNRDSHWGSEKGKHMRAILEAYARKNQFDPLNPQNWYHMRQHLFLEINGGKSILARYQGSHVNALMDLFPEIGLERDRFEILPRNFWNDMNNRRQFFLDFAAKEKFDPLVPENWYKMNVSRFYPHKGGYAILSNYDGDWPKALVHIFPDLGFDSSKFNYVLRQYWTVNERRELFEEFARSKGFDPKVISNWYSVRREEILPYKDMNIVLSYYEGSIRRALAHVFPGLEKSKLALSAKSYWKDVNTQRTIFETIAAQKGFDPLVANNWYSLDYETVTAVKGGVSMLSHYNGSYTNALLTVYPNIGLKRENFAVMPRRYWLDFNNQLKFFISFARESKFDPLIATNWYGVSKEEIAQVKGGRNILALHQHSLVATLKHVFPNIPFESHKFSQTLTEVYLSNAVQRRRFFERIAKEKEFDPLVPENWYRISASTVSARKGGKAIMSMYNGSLPSTLQTVFPEVTFDQSMFSNIDKRYFWMDIENQREFFRDYAKDKGFSPTVASNWYSVSSSSILARKGGKAILRYYGGNVRKALLHIFPDIGLAEINFASLPHKHWADADNQREIFLNFARTSGFDPLLAKNWQTANKTDFMNSKGARLVLDFYKGDFEVALRKLFPELK